MEVVQGCKEGGLLHHFDAGRAFLGESKVLYFAQALQFEILPAKGFGPWYSLSVSGRSHRLCTFEEGERWYELSIEHYRRVFMVCNAHSHQEQVRRHCPAYIGQGVRSHGNSTQVTNGQRERILQSPCSTVVEEEDSSPFLDGTGCESTDSRAFQQDGEGSHKVLHDAHGLA